MNHSGASLVESSIVSLFLIVFLTMGGQFAYYFYAKLWIDHHGYEALICLNTEKPAYKCKQLAIKKINNTLPFGSFEKIKLYKDQDKGNVQIQYKTSSNLNISYEKILRRQTLLENL